MHTLNYNKNGIECEEALLTLIVEVGDYNDTGNPEQGRERPECHHGRIAVGDEHLAGEGPGRNDAAKAGVRQKHHVQNADVADGVVEWDVQLAHELAERPVAEDCVDAEHGNDEEADEEVDEGVAHEDLVEDGLGLGLLVDEEDDEEVEGGGAEGEDEVEAAGEEGAGDELRGAEDELAEVEVGAAADVAAVEVLVELGRLDATVLCVVCVIWSQI